MSELKDRAKRTANLYGDPQLFALCNEIERLEAELAVSKKHGVLDVMRERDEARTALFRTQDELRRLEGLLRAWYREVQFDDPAVCAAEHALYDEAIRLAKAKP